MHWEPTSESDEDMRNHRNGGAHETLTDKFYNMCIQRSRMMLREKKEVLLQEKSGPQLTLVKYSNLRGFCLHYNSKLSSGLNERSQWWRPA
jgi:hypothetical protein